MKEMTQLALDTARRKGASYADIRIIEGRSEGLHTNNGAVAGLDKGESIGFGIRVIANGAWGFAACNKLSREEIQEKADLAVRIAKASASAKKEDVRFAPEPPCVDTWRTPCLIDPFKVSIESKLDLLFKIDAILRKSKKVVSADCHMDFESERQWFANTEGSYIDQYLLHSGAGYTATTLGNNDTQRRSYPVAGGQYAGLGYELVLGLELEKNAERVREEGVALLTAKPLPPGKRDIILLGNQMHLQIHESVGHATELDRVLGMEANYAGTSFATLEKIGKFKYGSGIVNLVADSSVPTGMATIGWDDDGVAAQRYHIVKDGILQAYSTNRELAHVVGEKRSRGCNRADGFASLPIIRIPNLSLMPGSWEWQDLLEDSDGAIVFDSNKCWSIDQQRLNFQFSTELAWEVRGGKLKTLYKNPTYQGITPEFWGSCDAICNQKHWALWGVNNCGKGQPGQRAQMSHGSAPTRFRNVNVGVGN